LKCGNIEHALFLTKTADEAEFSYSRPAKRYQDDERDFAKAVGRVHVKDGIMRYCTGFLVGDGYLMTANHGLRERIGKKSTSIIVIS